MFRDLKLIKKTLVIQFFFSAYSVIVVYNVLSVAVKSEGVYQSAERLL